MTTGKTIALTTWTFVGKVMSLLINSRNLRLTVLEVRKCKIKVPAVSTIGEGPLPGYFLRWGGGLGGGLPL